MKENLSEMRKTTKLSKQNTYETNRKHWSQQRKNRYQE